MALKQAVKDKLKTFGLDVDKLVDAVKADAEVDYAVPEDVTVINNTDLETRDNNNKALGKREGEPIGEAKGKELAAKQFKRKLSLPDTVPNDIDKVIDAANEQLSKGDTGLKDQIKLLQTDKETLINDKKALETKAQQAQFDSELISYFPASRTADLNDAERLALVKMNLSFETVDNKQVVKRNGEVLRDKTTQNPLAAKDVVASLFTEKNWVPKDGGTGGRGGGDNPPGGGGGIKKASAFQEKWKAENPDKNAIGAEYMDALAKHAKDIPDFDWHN